MNMTRILLWLLLLALPIVSAAEPSYPQWDGHEPVADYAKKVNLPPTQTLDLGDGVKMELVLIPAGRFIMGTPAPPPFDERGLFQKIKTGLLAFGASVSVMLLLLAVVTVPALRQKRRPQFSLAVLMLLTVAAGAGVLSGMHWVQAAQALRDARREYAKAVVLYSAAGHDEKPAHAVTLTKPYYMGKFEVTQQQYEQVLPANPSVFRGKDLPADSMTWEDACSFCAQLSVAGRVLRLPTEAEWEFACRAGTQTSGYSGDDIPSVLRVACCTGVKPVPVGQMEANAFGLYDMQGNVWEWCWDWYGDDYYEKSGAIDPKGPPTGRWHAIRGGSWMNGPLYSRSAARWSQPFGTTSNDVGFRVVMEVPEKGLAQPNAGSH